MSVGCSALMKDKSCRAKERRSVPEYTADSRAYAEGQILGVFEALSAWRDGFKVVRKGRCLVRWWKHGISHSQMVEVLVGGIIKNLFMCIK